MQSAPVGVPVLPHTPAQLSTIGVTVGHLRGPSWESVSRGLHVPVGVARLRPQHWARQRLVNAAVWMPADAALSGWAVPLLHGVAQLDGRDPRSLQPRNVSVLRDSQGGSRAPNGVTVVRRPLGQVTTVRVSVWDPITETVTRVRIPLVGLPVAVCDEVVGIERLDCAVAFCDQAVHSGRVTVDELRREVHRRRGRRGVERLRQVLGRVDAATASPWESILRVFCTDVLGWHGLTVNAAVHDRLRGDLVGVVDLLDADAGVVIEFDGAYHRDREQHRTDNVREERLEALGLVVVRVDSLDILRHSAALADRLREARRRGRGRDRTRDRWQVRRNVAA